MLTFIISFTGFLISIQIILNFSEQNIFIHKFQSQFLLSICILMSFVVYLQLKNIHSWIIIGTILMSLMFFLHFSKKYHHEIILQTASMILTELVVEMSSGQSLKKSISQILESQSGQALERDFILKQLQKTLFLHENQNCEIICPETRKFVSELLEIERSQIKNLEQIIFLRNYYFELNKFRHKSRQILIQPKLQSLIVSIIYLFFIIYGLNNNLKNYLGILLLSVFLFLLGILWIFNLGRGAKWKV